MEDKLTPSTVKKRSSRTAKTRTFADFCAPSNHDNYDCELAAMKKPPDSPPYNPVAATTTTEPLNQQPCDSSQPLKASRTTKTRTIADFYAPANLDDYACRLAAMMEPFNPQPSTSSKPVQPLPTSASHLTEDNDHPTPSLHPSHETSVSSASSSTLRHSTNSSSAMDTSTSTVTSDLSLDITDKLRTQFLTKAVSSSATTDHVKPMILPPVRKEHRLAFDDAIAMHTRNAADQAKTYLSSAERFLQRFNAHAAYRDNDCSTLPPILECRLLHSKFFSGLVAEREEWLNELRNMVTTALRPLIPQIIERLDNEFAQVLSACWNLDKTYATFLKTQLVEEAAKLDIPLEYADPLITDATDKLIAEINLLIPNDDVRTFCNIASPTNPPPQLVSATSLDTTNKPLKMATSSQHATKRLKTANSERFLFAHNKLHPNRLQKSPSSSTELVPSQDEGRLPQRKKPRYISGTSSSPTETLMDSQILSQSRKRKERFNKIRNDIHSRTCFFHNISDYSPTTLEAEVLNLGLKCVLTPPPDTDEALHSSFTQLQRSIRLRSLFRDNDMDTPTDTLRVRNPNFDPPKGPRHLELFLTDLEESFTTVLNTSKILRTPQQHHLNQLHKAVNSLRKNRNIVIKPADKNLGPVIMNADFYENLAYSILNDTATYQKLSNPPFTNFIFAKLRKILSFHSILHSHLANYLLQAQSDPSTKNAANFYILPKMHKTPIKGRPIVSCCGFVTYYASIWLDKMLKPIMRRSPSYIESSTDILLDLNVLELPPDCVLYSADVESLYPSIPINEGLEALTWTLQREGHSPSTIKLQVEIANWVLTNNYITFNGEFWRQIQGTAMGTPMAVVYANIFLSALEHKLFLTALASPFYYKRYIDDIFAIVSTAEEATTLTTAFNSQYETIKITHDYGHSVTFLDVTISKPSDLSNTTTSGAIQLKTALFQKPMNRYIYIPPTSYHQSPTFKAYISAELRRYTLLNSDPLDLLRSKNLLYERLLQRGYEPEFLRDIFDSTSFNRSDLINQIRQHKLKKTSHCSGNDKTSPPPFPIVLNWTPRSLSFPDTSWKVLPNWLFNDPTMINIFNTKRPFIKCYKPARNIGSLLVSSSYKRDVDVLNDD